MGRMQWHCLTVFNGQKCNPQQRNIECLNQLDLDIYWFAPPKLCCKQVPWNCSSILTLCKTQTKDIEQMLDSLFVLPDSTKNGQMPPFSVVHRCILTNSSNICKYRHKYVHFLYFSASTGQPLISKLHTRLTSSQKFYSRPLSSELGVVRHQNLAVCRAMTFIFQEMYRNLISKALKDEEQIGLGEY